MTSFSPELPESISFNKGTTMTFLRSEPYLTLNRFSGEQDAELLDVPPHWHESHDEIIQVVKGKLEIRLGSNVQIYTPEDGDILIARGVVHSLRTLKGVECIFYERTDPMDEEKELFFRNILGRGTFPPSFLDGMLCFYHGDTYPAFPGHFMWLEKLFVTLFGGYLASFLGYRRLYETLKKTE